MDEKNLLKVALICSVIGIFIIFLFADRLEPSLISISDISDSLLDRDVRIQGKISSIKESSSVLILEVKDDSSAIKVVAFDNDYSNFKKNQSVEILGVVKEYKGVLEIESKQIISI